MSILPSPECQYPLLVIRKTKQGSLTATETVTLTSPTFTTRSGRRIFIPVNIFNQIKSIPSRVDNRRSPVYREFAFLDTDSIIFHLPSGFKPETIPHGKSLTTAFGEYCSTLNVMGDQILYTRRIKMNRGQWPKEQYAALVDFYTSIVSADKIKLVIRGGIQNSKESVQKKSKCERMSKCKNISHYNEYPTYSKIYRNFTIHNNINDFYIYFFTILTTEMNIL